MKLLRLLLGGLAFAPPALAADFAPPVTWFPLSDVRVLGGPFKHAEIMNRAWLLALDPDRLLWHFRHNAELPTTTQPYGGWEGADWDFAGHTLGHYLSACALMAAHGDEAEFQQRVDYIVAELAKCQAALASKASPPGFLDPLPEERFARLEFGKGGGGVPYYTMHKTMTGLIDAYELAHNTQALEVMKQLAARLSRSESAVGGSNRQVRTKGSGSALAAKWPPTCSAPSAAPRAEKRRKFAARFCAAWSSGR